MLISLGNDRVTKWNSNPNPSCVGEIQNHIPHHGFGKNRKWLLIIISLTSMATRHFKLLQAFPWLHYYIIPMNTSFYT